jgi:hypothetical protein
VLAVDDDALAEFEASALKTSAVSANGDGGKLTALVTEVLNGLQILSKEADA